MGNHKKKQRSQQREKFHIKDKAEKLHKEIYC